MRLPWPLPAVLCWGLGWAVFGALGAAGTAPPLPALAGAAAALGSALAIEGGWRRVIAAAGFPLSAWALGAAAAPPPWAWAAAAALLLALYPLRAWRDAPFFPTPASALAGLDDVVLPPPSSVLDAGCGLGHGLRALARLWPQARLHGVEWSRPLAWVAAHRLPAASIWRGDMWASSWTGHDLVYLFQRPETMERAWAKAAEELAPGAWLVSLQFEVPGVRPVACLGRPGLHRVWIYRIDARAAAAAQSSARPTTGGSTAGRPRR
jgi:hypothetical protein